MLICLLIKLIASYDVFLCQTVNPRKIIVRLLGNDTDN